MSGSVLVDREGVRDLYDDYIACLDAEDFDAWLDLFVEDSEYRVVSRENFDRGLPLATMRCDSRSMLADRIHTIRNTQTFAPRRIRRFFSGLRALPASGSDVEVSASFLVIESLDDEPSRVHLAGRYADLVTGIGGDLKFRRKIAIYDSPIIPVSLIYPV